MRRLLTTSRTNDSNSVCILDTFVGLSDHCGVGMSLSFRMTCDESKTITYRDTKTFNPAHFSADLAATPWDSCFVFDDVNDQYSHFSRLLKDVLDVHAPLKTVKIK